jgi:hypothetical protein
MCDGNTTIMLTFIDSVACADVVFFLCQAIPYLELRSVQPPHSTWNLSSSSSFAVANDKNGILRGSVDHDDEENDIHMNNTNNATNKNKNTASSLSLLPFHLHVVAAGSSSSGDFDDVLTLPPRRPCFTPNTTKGRGVAFTQLSGNGHDVHTTDTTHDVDTTQSHAIVSNEPNDTNDAVISPIQRNPKLSFNTFCIANNTSSSSHPHTNAYDENSGVVHPPSLPCENYSSFTPDATRPS